MNRKIKCHPSTPESEVVSDIAAVLEEGGAVVLPTETQYGLAVRADRDGALKQICQIKCRDSNLRPALFVKDMQMTAAFCHISPEAERLADHFLPGPLTLVLPVVPGQTAVSMDFVSEQGVGIRISSSPLVRAVMHAVPFPVTATSANKSGMIAPRSVDDIRESLGEAVDLYVDGGNSRGIVPSTVVRVADTIDFLRHGAVPESEIRAVLKEGKV